LFLVVFDVLRPGSSRIRRASLWDTLRRNRRTQDCPSKGCLPIGIPYGITAEHGRGDGLDARYTSSEVIKTFRWISFDPGSSGLWMGKSRKGQLVNVGKGNIVGRCVFYY